jgi:cysteine-rich repeat protein
VSGDGCSDTCELETGWICGDPGVACHQPTCGDGIQDGWYIPAGGASSAGGPSSGGASSSGAGGTSSSGGSGPYGTYYYEDCDDMNTVSGDGCSSECVIESGWVCPTPATACHQPGCGNGFIDFTPWGTGGAGGATGSSGASSTGGSGPSGTIEQCDDLNTISGDGCSAECTFEPGFGCEVPGACHVAVCGDGIVDYPAEQCDDGNQVANDGCTQCVYDFGGSGSGGSGGRGHSAGAPGR